MDGSAQLTEVRFSKKRQGYDPDEVDNFLERVGEKVYELQEKVRSVTKRAEAAESKLGAAMARADAVEQEASRRSESASTTAQPAAKSAEAEDLEETLKNALVLAQRTADTAIKEATAEAERIVNEAQATADRLANQTDATCKRKLDEADREAQQRIDAASGPIKTEVLRLEERQKSLTDDTAVLESHLEAQRARIRDALATLQSVVDDPAKFATDRRPATSTGDAPSRPSATNDTAARPTEPARPSVATGSSTAPSTSPSDAPTSAPAADSAPPTPPAAEREAPPLDTRPAPAAGSRPLARPTARPAAATASARPSAPPRPSARPADDGGPPTAQIDLTSEPPVFEDDNFLDELRRAVGEGEGDPPPGGSDEADEAMQAFFEQRDGDLDPDRRRSRFGRRH